jgi:peptidoglycan/LPS O-acetylase OafA/YrhL
VKTEKTAMLWPVLGGVRFLLALIVANGHMALFLPASGQFHHFDNLSGLAAVLGFLVISGFSIAASYAKKPQGFYRRRAIRIVPLYVLAIILSAVCTRPFGGIVHGVNGNFYRTPSWSIVVQNLFFAQGFTVRSIATDTAVWSLSIEVFFYLFTPLLSRLSQAALVLVAGASLGLFLISPSFDALYYAYMRTGAAAALLGWAWLAGFIAFRHRDHLRAAAVVLGLSIVALALNPNFEGTHWLATIGIVGIALGFGNRLSGPRWLASVLSLLGDVSYPLYLFHMPIYIMLCGFHVPMMGGGYLLTAIGISMALDRLYDQPVKHLFTGPGKLKAQPVKDCAVPVAP